MTRCYQCGKSIRAVGQAEFLYLTQAGEVWIHKRCLAAYERGEERTKANGEAF